MLDPLYVSLTSALGSAIAVGVTLARRRNHVVEGLRSELNLALEENAKAYVGLSEYFKKHNVSVEDAISLLAIFVTRIHLALWNKPEMAQGWFHEALDEAFEIFKEDQ